MLALRSVILLQLAVHGFSFKYSRPGERDLSAHEKLAIFRGPQILAPALLERQQHDPIVTEETFHLTSKKPLVEMCAAGSVLMVLICFMAYRKCSKEEPTLQHWFAVVFLQALLALIVQIVLGLLTGSLALLADAVHGLVDVLSYGVSWAIECAKLRAEAKEAPWCSARWLDLGGCIGSIVVLLISSGFIAYEAYESLTGKEAHPALPADTTKWDMRGPALLVFAFVNFIGNALMLVLYRRWNLGNANQAKKSKSPKEIHDHEDEQQNHHEDLDHEHKHQDHGHGEQHGDHVCKHSCQVKQQGQEGKDIKKDEHVHSCETSCSSHSNNTPSAGDVGEMLHLLVHPGCGAGATPSSNLNLNATMLHLISDVLRSFVILAAGVLIMFEVQWATQVDGIGALLITGFNILGCGVVLAPALREAAK